MEKDKIVDTILNYYKSNFDIERDYAYADQNFIAYARFYAKNERYFVTAGTTIWSYDSNEHLFVVDYDSLKSKEFSYWREFIETKAEPHLVRNNEKLPSKNHEYSYITIVLVSDSPYGTEFIKKLKSYNYYKNYLFSIRGYCSVRIVAVDCKGHLIESTRSGRDIKKLYNRILKY